jgi:hypothetical protein
MSFDLTYARARRTCALFTVVSGAVIAVTALTFDAASVRWIAFGGGCAVLSALMVAFAIRGRGTAQRIIDLPLALVCAWAIVCSRVIEHAGAGASPGAVKWFNLAAGAAICGFGTLGVLLHERGMDRDLEWAAERIQSLQATAVAAHALPGADVYRGEDAPAEGDEGGYAHAGTRTVGR